MTAAINIKATVAEPGQDQLSMHLIGFMANFVADRSSQTAGMDTKLGWPVTVWTKTTREQIVPNQINYVSK